MVRQLAAGVDQLTGFPRDAINQYLAGGVLFDCGMRSDLGRIRRDLAGRKVESIALTHAHSDHQGACRGLRAALGVEVACGRREADAVESGNLLPTIPPNPLGRFVAKCLPGPPCPVGRRLAEGDEVGGGFRAIDTPGHSPGHVAYWREDDRVLIVGDLLTNLNLFTLRPGLHEPPAFFTVDPAENRRSARKLLAMGIRPALACFGHGPPLRDPEAFARFVEGLAD